MAPLPIWSIRRVAMILIVAALVTSARADNLYEGRTIVTGQIEDTRVQGIKDCFVQVLAKVSGDGRLIGDARVAVLAEAAAALVTGLSYRDRMAGIPVHDEQGTYDRPFDLAVSFDAAGIHAALRSLGREPWTEPRPSLVLFVTVNNPAGPFVLAADADRGAEMRRALSNAVELVGVPVALPDLATLAKTGADVDSLTVADPATFQPAVASDGGQIMTGTLSWSDADMGWAAGWRITVDGQEFRWGVRGVSFDAAFRNALRGAAQILSGNGQPP